MDVLRALVTGPADTPYSRGCFIFDIYCPANYPKSPPMVKLCTTGHGTVRQVFRPLIACCISNVIYIYIYMYLNIKKTFSNL